ncbi:MAG TPA: serine hydrolase [Ktedonobacteraceae bacterium]
MQQQPSFIVSRKPIILVLVSICGFLLLSCGFLISGQRHDLPATPTGSKVTVMNGANRWDSDSKVTAPSFDFSANEPQSLSVSPLFEPYYHSHSGATSLGVPVSAAFPSDQGWIQFFAWGALLLPSTVQGHTYDADGPLMEPIDAGVKDSRTGIMRLPLLQPLLTAGSRVPVGGDGSPLTYVDLRKATSPDRMLTAPPDHITSPSPVGQLDVFVKGGIRAGKDVGHLIPLPLWNSMHRADISPDGWETDFGPPLTEALAFLLMVHGSVHQMLVQAFWRDALLLDESALDASGQPLIQRLESGVDYLRTFGPPPVAIGSQRSVWAQGETALLDAPSTGRAVAHVGQHFSLALLGDATWKSGMLWYHVAWAAPKGTGNGWVEASAVTFTSPGNVPGWASFDVLSPPLAAYLASIGDSVDAVVYDVTRQRYYTYHASAQFITGSSMKVPIMLTFLDMTERQGRQPDADEMNLLTTMIENSNNDSASALYYGEIGGAAGVASYLHSIGITGLNPDPDAWGWSLISPQAMVNLLTDLYQGKILTVRDRNLAFYLMEHIESDQRVGVGDTAPSGSTVAMKDGWLPGPDNLWAMNSSGIVTVSKETYIIAVYTRGQDTLEDGQSIARHVCGTVASLLT